MPYLEKKALECEQVRVMNQARLEKLLLELKDKLQEHDYFASKDLFNKISLICQENIESFAKQFFYEKRYITADKHEIKRRKDIYVTAGKIVRQELDKIKDVVKLTFPGGFRTCSAKSKQLG